MSSHESEKSPNQNRAGEPLSIRSTRSPSLDRLMQMAEASFHAARSKATVRAYEHDWKMFKIWCAQHGYDPLPATPEALILYATDLTKNDKRRLNTLVRRFGAISQLHSRAGFETPTRAWAVRQFMAGLRRELGVAPERKRPLLVGDLKQALDAVPATRLGHRDRALLLLGFTGAFRRSELVAIDIEDVFFAKQGLVIQVRRSKTDQEAEGRPVGVPYGQNEATCAVRAVEKWMSVAGFTTGALFRCINRHETVSEKRLSGEAVAIVVKRYLGALGFDADLFAGHSLRSGLATSAAAAGKSERSIMKQTGHRTTETVRRYIRDGSLFRDNAAEGLGL